MPAESPKRPKRILSFLLTALALVLSWLVVSRTLVAYLERINPEWALAIRASDADAELKLANVWLARTAQAEGDLAAPNPNFETREQVRQRLLRALHAEPLNAWGFELLGMLAAGSGDTLSATTFMQAAMERSLRRPAASYWLLRQSLSGKNVDSAINYADALLRIRPDLISEVTPALVEIAAIPSGAEGLIDTLATAPPWRTKFFIALAGDAKGDTKNVE